MFLSSAQVLVGLYVGGQLLIQVILLHLCNLVAKILSAVESSHIGEPVLMQISECFLISDVVFLTI